MQQGEHVIWGVHSIDSVFWKEVTVALRPLLKVLLLSFHNIVKVDRYKVVSVRSCMFMDKSKSMNQLVNWPHQALIETAAVEEK